MNLSQRLDGGCGAEWWGAGGEALRALWACVGVSRSAFSAVLTLRCQSRSMYDLARFRLLAPIACGLLLVASTSGANAQALNKSTDQLLAEARSSIATDPDRATMLIERVERNVRSMPRSRGRMLAYAKLLWLRGEINLRANNLGVAHQEIEVALKLAERIPGSLELQADLLKAEGTLHAQEGAPARALDNYQRAFSIYQQINSLRSQSVVLQLIAQLYVDANDFDSARKYFRQAGELYDKDPALSVILRNNLGNAFLQLDRLDDASEEYRKALLIAHQTNSRNLEATVLANLARSELENGEIDAAERSVARAFQLVGGGDARGMAPHLNATAARAAFKRGQLKAAIALINRAFEGVNLDQTDAAFRNDHLIAYQIYSRAGDSARALKHLEALKRLTDEATKVATTTSAALMAARFDYANQELRIAKLQAEQANRRTEIERARAHFQRAIFLVAAVATAIGFGLLGFFLMTLRRSRNEVRAANAGLAETNLALEKALAAKTEFLATTSHEIRTPLNGILGMTQVMLADPALPDPTRERIGVVHGAGITMRALVDDILDVAKMETGNLTIEPLPMDLPAMLRDVARLWEEQARAKGVGFAIDLSGAPQWIVGDAGRLRQIVFNLLSNALKFTEAGQIGVAAHAAGDRLCIVVRDSGIGIPAEKCELIFESFKQVDASMTRRFGGTGLGLTICRNLAHAMGGTIRVESREGEGSSFTVELPLVLADPVAAAGPAAGSGVLVLERNPIARSMVRTLLEARDVPAGFAAKPQEAIECLSGGAFGVLLIDEASLDAQGDARFAKVAELVAAANRVHAASIVLWSGDSTEEQALLAVTGIGRVLRKPVSGATLVEVLMSEWDAIRKNYANLPLVSEAA